ncbi:MAG: glycosyltransferase family 2 protein [Pyrinomonadaceae bacterium]
MLREFLDHQQVRAELSFIIVNWNGGELLRRCLKSIASYRPGVPYEVVVVDNASTDGSREWLRSDGPSQLLAGAPLRLIESDENLGFGRANNRAFAATSTPLLFLLNSDAELQPGACDALISTLRGEARVGVCGPRLVNPDGSTQISVWRNPPVAWATFLAPLKPYRLPPRRLCGELLLAEHWAHDRRRDVPMLSGAALLVRREVVEEVGGFDERYHMYAEDNEWCLRIARAGWRMVFEPSAVVMHHGGHGSRQRWTDQERLRVQSDAFFLFQRTCLSRRQATANRLASVAQLSLRRAWRWLRGRPAEDLGLTLRLHFTELKRSLREWGRRSGS